MGGKGGGGGGDAAAVLAQYDTTSHPGYYIHRTTGDVIGADGITRVGNKDTMWPTAQPEAAAPAPAPAAAAPAPEPAAAPVADTSPPKNDTLAPSIGGGSDVIADPAAPGGAGSGIDNAGSTLGGAVLKPPKYWTGNIDKYKSGSTSKGGGSMTTTQT